MLRAAWIASCVLESMYVSEAFLYAANGNIVFTLQDVQHIMRCVKYMRADCTAGCGVLVRQRR